MKILLLGSGGREHALAWNIYHRKGEHQLFIAPGNPGTAACGFNVQLSITDFNSIGDFCISEKIKMVIVGPEEPLVKGLWDYFKSQSQLRDILFIGPSQAGAQLEGSKSYAKAFMLRHQIPTADYKEFSEENFEEGLSYIKAHQLPVVLKANGLAAGKGVIICESHEEAITEFEAMIQQSKFGDASKKVVVEQFLSGIEMSIFLLTDGKYYVELPAAKDYKRIGEHDSGLNTGGMGALSPVPFATDVFMEQVREKIIGPTIRGLEIEKIAYTGFVFIGIIKVGDEPFVIEYNCRMGDPETEVVMPRLKNNLADICIAAAENKLQDIKIQIDPRIAVTTVAVSGGYPEIFEKGYKINGLDQILDNDSIIFQAGTDRTNEGKIITNGGRVLCATAFGDDLTMALSKSKKILEHIKFDDMYYRKDIGWEFL